VVWVATISVQTVVATGKLAQLARLFASLTLLVLAAVTLASWGFLAWLVWHVIWR
jgi:hypothetical protein